MLNKLFGKLTVKKETLIELSLSSTRSFTSGWQKIHNQADVDNLDEFDRGNNVINVNETGWYLVTAGCTTNGSSGDRVGIRIRDGSTSTTLAREDSTNTAGTFVTISSVVKLESGNNVAVQFQNFTTSDAVQSNDATFVRVVNTLLDTEIS
jgi:hypothetical protein